MELGSLLMRVCTRDVTSSPWQSCLAKLCSIADYGHCLIGIPLPEGTFARTTNSTLLGEHIRCRLRVDDVCLRMQTQKYAVGYKNITANDNFFTGHFPERKIMPGAALTAPS